jgi:RNA polymerase sigma factor (sigma-70 family)
MAVEGNYKKVSLVSPGVSLMSQSLLAAGLRHLRSKLATQQRSEDSDEHLLQAFAVSRDDNAFAVLVRRHGPMVLHVCRRVLDHEQDAEDAFQATFLVLARNSAVLRKKTALGSFLHGTAFRLALRARRAAARRRRHEGQAPARPSVYPTDELSWREVRTILDEEILRLPEKYRIIFVLCCLEERSRDEVARQLGVTERTVSNWLAEARKRLERRLSRRGVELTAVLAVSGVSLPSASALPPVLVASTIKAALAIVAGEGLIAVLSAPVAELVEKMPSLMMSKTKTAVLLLLVVAVLGGAGAWAYRGLTTPAPALPGDPPDAKANDKPAAVQQPRKPAEKMEIHGRVLGPDGKPKAGAQLRLLDPDGLTELGATAADGHFAVVVPKEKKNKGPVALLAHSQDTGLDFVSLAGWDAAKAVELRLGKDHPIRGRIVNTEGKPIRGVRVSVSDIDVYANNSLESFFVLWQKRPADYAVPPGEKTLLLRSASLLNAVTDADGRFAIAGVGTERVAELSLRGGGIATTTLRIVNRAGFDPKPFNQPSDDAYRSAPKRMNPPPVGMMLQGPNVAVVAEPEKPIRGMVKDADSGKGVPNQVVRLEQRDNAMRRPFITTKTDAQGRFEFRGAHKEKTYSLFVEGDSSLGYLSTRTSPADTVGYSPINLELPIKKGVIITGKIIDKATGKSVPGFAQFVVLPNNPFVKDFPPFVTGRRNERDETAADGTFRVVAIPGPVLLMGGYYPPRTSYDSRPVVLVHGNFAPFESKFDYIEFSKYRTPVVDPEYPQYFSNRPGRFLGYHTYGGGIGGLDGGYCKVLDIKPGTKMVQQDILLERASVLEVKIQDADGKPVTAVWATDFATHRFIGPLWIERSTCPVYGLEARKPRLLIFYEPQRKIIGSQRLQGDEKGPIMVKLGSMATIKGRLLDIEGKPLADAVATEVYRDGDAEQIHRLIHASTRVVTDATGAFTLEYLIPEMPFKLSIRHGKRSMELEPKPAEAAVQVKAGECHDLGEIHTSFQK